MMKHSEFGDYCTNTIRYLFHQISASNFNYDLSGEYNIMVIPFCILLHHFDPRNHFSKFCIVSIVKNSTVIVKILAKLALSL